MLRNSNSQAARRAVSLLEITACILAVAIGVWVGARYLGLDLHAVAYTALSEADVMDQLPEDWRPTPPAGLEVKTAEQEAATLNAELELLQQEVAQLGTEAASQSATASGAGESVAAGGSESTENLDPSLIERRQHTLAYWSQLGSIRDSVDRLQASAELSLTQQNVYKVLEIRKRAYDYGAKAVRTAMNDGVDPQALQFAEQLAAWYEHGAALYGEALNVWQGDSPPVGGLPSDQLLKQVRQQHDNEAMLLFQKGDRLGEVFFHRYQVAFPQIDESTNPQQ